MVVVAAVSDRRVKARHAPRERGYGKPSLLKSSYQSCS